MWRASAGTGLVRTLSGADRIRDTRDLGYPPEVAVLEYVVLEQHTVVFVHRAGQPLMSHAIDLERAAIDNAVQKLLGSPSGFPPARYQCPWRLDSGDPTPSPELVALAPLVDWVPAVLHDCETLIVIASGALHHVPFHALPTNPTPRYLIEDWDVAYHVVLRPNEEPVTRELAPGVVAGCVKRTDECARLDAHLQRVAKTIGVGTQLLSSDAVSPEQLVEHMTRHGPFRALYVHGHGHSDDEDPLRRGIVLTEEDHGILNGHMLSRIAQPGQLVFLAACLTGHANVGYDDEVVGLVRPLLLSGIESIVTAGWSYEAASGRALSERFFANWLERRMGRAHALAEAQRAMLHGDFGAQWQNPFMWAPFRLLGEWK